jgi:U3 small nucleolar RNA-associated protein 10
MLSKLSTFRVLDTIARPDAPWNFLNAYKSAAQSVPRTALVTEMLRNVVVARFVASALPKAVKEKTVHHALIAFHTSVLLEYVSRAKALDDVSLVFLLPAMLEPLQESVVRSDTLTKDVVVSAPFSFFPDW